MDFNLINFPTIDKNFPDSRVKMFNFGLKIDALNAKG